MKVSRRLNYRFGKKIHVYLQLEDAVTRLSLEALGAVKVRLPNFMAKLPVRWSAVVVLAKSRKQQIVRGYFEFWLINFVISIFGSVSVQFAGVCQGFSVCVNVCGCFL